MKESKRIQREIAKETGASPGEINEAFATRMLIDFGTAIDARNADIQRTSPERPQAGRAEVSAETRSLETSAIQQAQPSSSQQSPQQNTDGDSEDYYVAINGTLYTQTFVVSGEPTEV